MAYIGEESDVMRPQVGDTKITLPVTFDYSGGRSENNKYKMVWAVAFTIVGIILAIGVLTRANMGLIPRLILFVLVLLAVMFILRFGFFNETGVRKYYKDLEATDYKIGYSDFWGIYSIDEEYPYYVRFRNGRTGLFVRLNKDVILGKYSESEFEHYEAMGDAYNIAASCNIIMEHVDTMGDVGSDDRLEESFVEIENVKNTDVKDVLKDMFGYLQAQMNERVTTYDIYVFTFNCNEISAWGSINRILSCMMEANYVGYHILDMDDIKEMFKTLYHIHEFSANSAMLETFAMDGAYGGIIPIKVIHNDGSVNVYNKTMKEKQEEFARAEEAKKVKDQEKKNRKLKKKKGNDNTDNEDDEDFSDIFDD